jgi:excisionase family DNA binding protein
MTNSSSPHDFIPPVLELVQYPYLSLAQTARVLGVSVNTLTVEVRSGRLEVIRMGGRGRRVLIPKAARERWSERNTKAWESADAV